jgi:hypothetical protein
VQRPADIRYLLGGPAIPRKCHILAWDICTRARSTFARTLASVPFHFAWRFLIHFLHCLFIVGGFCYNIARRAILQQVSGGGSSGGGVSCSPSCSCLIWAILCGLGSFSLLVFAVSVWVSSSSGLLGSSFSWRHHFFSFLITPPPCSRLVDYSYHLLAFGAIWFVFLHAFFHQWAGGVIVSASCSSGGLDGKEGREDRDYYWTSEEISGKRKSWIWF